VNPAAEEKERPARPGLLVPACLAVSGIVLALLVGAGESGILDISATPSILLLTALSGMVGARSLGVGRRAVSLDTIVGIHLAVTFALVTVLVFFTGGSKSPFVVVYALTTITGSLFREIRGGVVFACAASLVVGIFASEYGSGPLGPLAYAGSMLALGLLTGSLVQRARIRGALLDEARENESSLVAQAQRVMDSVPVGIVTATPDGKITRINQAAAGILGFENAAGLAGFDLCQYLERIAPRLVESFESAAATGKWSVREETVLGEGRDARPIGVSMTPFHGEGDSSEGVVVAITDLHEMRRMEKEMRRAGQLAALGELAAGIAHEIRNPLASISGAVEMLREEVRGEGDQVELMNLIVKESERLNRIINGFLDYTRDHSRSKALYDISQIAREVVRLVSLDKKLSLGKTILVEFPSRQDFRAMVEEEGIKQVFFNLARNALEAMQLGGILRISGESPGDGRIYTVFRDTGEGIAPHELEQVFKPFHTSKADGTGLGLSIARRIVDGHGGAIRIKSTPGVGTAITVELAAAEGHGSSFEGQLPKREEQNSALTALES
jgi:signal transduction histidine kinase